MQIEEHETILNFDYSGKQVRIYTTRQGVINGITRRLGTEALKQCTVSRLQGAWEMEIPMSLVRSPEMLVRLSNPDLKGASPFPDLAS